MVLGGQMRGIVWVAAGAAACGGLPQPGAITVDPTGCIEVEPARVDFGDVDRTIEAGDAAVREIEVRNACRGTLRVSGMAVDADDVGLFGFTQGSIGPDHAQILEVHYAPTGPGRLDAKIAIGSSDPEQTTTWIGLEGTARAPQLDVEPAMGIDLGSLTIGCSARQPLQIRNAGTSDLVVSSIGFASDTTRELRVDLNRFHNGSLPFRLGPHEPPDEGPVVQVFVDYLSLDEVADAAVLELHTNDPAQPLTLVDVRAVGVRFSRVLDVFEPGAHDGVSFGLTRAPVPESLRIRVDGADRVDGWDYSAAANEVVMTRAPAVESLVEVIYDLATDCED